MRSVIEPKDLLSIGKLSYLSISILTTISPINIILPNLIKFYVNDLTMILLYAIIVLCL